MTPTKTGTVPADAPKSTAPDLAASFAHYTSPGQLAEILGPCVDELDRSWWEEALFDPVGEYLSRPGKSFRSLLVQHCWTLAGGSDDVPKALPTLVEILHAGSLIIDDIQDEAMSRRGHLALHREMGTPLAINAGNWLYFWPSLLIQELDLDASIEVKLRQELGRTLWRCHCGQALDLKWNASSIDRAMVSKIVGASSRLKTGALMSFAASAPAIIRGLPDEQVQGFAEFGQRLGVALQMLDDLSAVCNEDRAGKAHEDFQQDTPTWAWVWACENMTAEEFADLQQTAIEVRDSLRPARALLEKMRPAICTSGRAAVHSYVGQAFGAMRSVTTDTAALETMEHEVTRLEKAYG